MMLSFRPSLEVHGWLLDLDTRCRFWSAVLEPSASSSLAVTAAAAPRPQHDSGDVLVEGDDEDDHAGGETVPGQSFSALVFSVSSAEDGEAAAAAAAPLPRVIVAATAALEASRRGGSGGSVDDGLAGAAGGGEVVEGVRRRLEQTLQQVAVHRVQQIYAHLNGIAALEAAEELPAASAASGEEREEEGETGKGAAAAAEDKDARFEEEARGLVAFACESCGYVGSRAGDTIRWGDEAFDCGGGNSGGASWSMMMPYLPVWVGFAAKKQVSGWDARHVTVLQRRAGGGALFWCLCDLMQSPPFLAT